VSASIGKCVAADEARDRMGVGRRSRSRVSGSALRRGWSARIVVGHAHSVERLGSGLRGEGRGAAVDGCGGARACRCLPVVAVVAAASLVIDLVAVGVWIQRTPLYGSLGQSIQVSQPYYTWSRIDWPRARTELQQWHMGAGEQLS
jgi:hypothetical protein